MGGGLMSAGKLVEAIKLAGLQAVNNSKPADFVIGRVISVQPVNIETEQGSIIGENFITLSETLTDRFVYMTAVRDDFNDIKDKNTYENRKKYALYGRLNIGENVILARAAGGQKYFVIDRL